MICRMCDTAVVPPTTIHVGPGTTTTSTCRFHPDEDLIRLETPSPDPSPITPMEEEIPREPRLIIDKDATAGVDPNNDQNKDSKGYMTPAEEY